MWSVLKRISAFHSCNDSKKQCYSACSLIWTNLVLPTIWCINQQTFKNNWLLVGKHFCSYQVYLFDKVIFVWSCKGKLYPILSHNKIPQIENNQLDWSIPLFFCINGIYELKKLSFYPIYRSCCSVTLLWESISCYLAVQTWEIVQLQYR